MPTTNNLKNLPGSMIPQSAALPLHQQKDADSSLDPVPSKRAALTTDTTKKVRESNWTLRLIHSGWPAG